MRYKLRMLGVPMKERAWVFGDNLSVTNNCSKPESILKKKNHACYFHMIRELCAAGIVSLHHIKSGNNRADALTKALPSNVFYRLIKTLFFNREIENRQIIENIEEPRKNKGKDKTDEIESHQFTSAFLLHRRNSCGGRYQQVRWN